MPNAHLSSIILASSHAAEEETNDTSGNTELDSHANMVVLGSPSIVLNTTGKTVSVNPFSPDFKPLNVPLVDGATLYDCPHSMQTYVLVFTNALLVPSMNHNLVPPFILREAGIQVKDIPKIHVPNPTPDDHTIIIPHAKLRIPLHLNGIFSYFTCRKPTPGELHEFSDAVYLLTPPGEWNPNTEVFATNEANMSDHEGNIITANPSPHRLLLDDTPVPDHIANAFQIHSLSNRLSSACSIAPLELYDSNYPESLAEHLSAQRNMSDFSITVGSTTAHLAPHLFDDSSKPITQVEVESLDLDSTMSSTIATHRTKGFTAEHLSKVWRTTAPRIHTTL